MENIIDLTVCPSVDDALARVRPLETPLLSLALSRVRRVEATGNEGARVRISVQSGGAPSTIPLVGTRIGTRSIETRRLSATPTEDEAAKFKSNYNLGRWLFSGGIINQISAVVRRNGAWTAENFLALARKFFASADSPAAGVLFASTELLGHLQAIDWTGHSEITFARVADPIGLAFARVRTLYGDIDIVRDPSLDLVDYGSSGALVDLDRLARFCRPAEIDDGSATLRDSLALVGSCHVWIDGAPTDSTKQGNIIGIPIGDELYDGDFD